MVKLLSFSPLEGSAFYEDGGKVFHTGIPFTPSCTEEVENGQEFSQMTIGYLDGQGRVFEDLAHLQQFLGECQIWEIENNPKLVKNRALLAEARIYNQQLREAKSAEVVRAGDHSGDVVEKDLRQSLVNLSKQIDSQLNPKYTFEYFLQGDCNRLARAASYAVAVKPGLTAFTPLLLYGEVGLGKTHLAQAIGNETISEYPDKIVLYISTEKFCNQSVEAVKNKTVSNFLGHYQQADMLIVDDIQFFAGKEKSQDHFFHVFNHLHLAGKQVVLTSAGPPIELKGIEERLLSRFNSGLSTELGCPDFHTRVAILKNKMYRDGIELPGEVIEYIATNVISDVRALETALISLLAQSSLNKRDVDLDLAMEMLKNFIVTYRGGLEKVKKATKSRLKVVTDESKGESPDSEEKSILSAKRKKIS